jgi:hypothetical protein
VRIDDDIWAIDTASTNGTTRGEKEIAAVALRDPDELCLAGDTTVRYRRIALN